ncbi:C166 family protein [Microdochium nivale]|nr:C166 family protein [Microdochium nivale]
MRFSILSTAVATLALCGDAVQAALTPNQIVDNIRTLTQKSQAIQIPAQSVSILNGQLLIIGQGPFPQIIDGFNDIVIFTTTAIAQMQGSAPVMNSDDATAIFQAFSEFVRVQKVLLDVLISKAGFFQTVPFVGQRVYFTLREVEAITDTFALDLIKLVESQVANLRTQASMLKDTLIICIKAYGGVSVNGRSLPNSASFRTLRA